MRPSGMSAKVLRSDRDEVVIELTIPKSSNFLEAEEQIQQSLNEAGKLATRNCLEDFDTDGSPLIVGNQKLTAKTTPVAKKYETPYGPVNVERFAYQSSSGGTTHIPLEHNARIVGNSTPRFAKMVSFKYSHANAGVVQDDLRQSLGRDVSRCYVQDVSALVAGALDSKQQSVRFDNAGEEPPPEEVATIAVGLDGACMMFCEEGYRQAMVGTISFYDAGGERLHTHYVAAAPEYGKPTFLASMEKEIERIKERFGDARYVGVSDGASDYRTWLKAFTTTQVLDFWHLSEYLAEVSEALFPRREKRREWLEASCHRLKHQHGAAADILAELEKARENPRLDDEKRELLERTIGYMHNNADRTNYASYRKRHIPIGSGVTEAACKTVVKARMCGSGMKWKFSGSQTVLTLRAKTLTRGAWANFWAHVAQYGI